MLKLRFETELDYNLADSLLSTAHSKLKQQKKEENIIWAIISLLMTIVCISALYVYFK